MSEDVERLKLLRDKREALWKKINRRKKTYDNAYRIYMRQRSHYEELLYEYKKVDYEMAEIDGRLTVIDKETIRVANALKQMSNKERQELYESLKELL